MATTDARAAPVADDRPPAAKGDEVAAAAEERSKRVAAEVGGGGIDGEEVRFEGKDRSPAGSEANNGVVEAEAVVGDAKDESDGEVEPAAAAAAEEESGDRESVAEDAEAAAPLAPAPSDSSELGEGYASLPTPDAPVAEDKGELVDEPAALEVKDVGEAAPDAELSVEKLEDAEVVAGGEDDGEFGSQEEVVVVAEPEDKVAPIAEANGKLGGEADAPVETVAVGGEETPEASLETVEDKAAEPEPESDASPVIIAMENHAIVEDGAAEPEVESDANPVVIDNGSLENHADVENEVTNPSVVGDSGLENHADVEDKVAKPEPENDASPVVADNSSFGSQTNVEDEAAKPEPKGDASHVVIDGSDLEISEKLAPVTSDIVLNESNENAQNAEGQVAASGTVQDVSVEKPTEVESVVAGGTDVVLSRELAPEPIEENNDAAENENAAEVIGHIEEAGDDDIVVAAAGHDQKAVAADDDEERGGEENEGAPDVSDREVEAVDDEIVLLAADDEDGSGNEGDEDDDEVSFDRSPARVAIIENSEAAKQIMKELGEGSSSGSPVSGLSSSREYTNSMDGQIVLDDSEDDEDDDDNEDDDEKGFDSAALAALLKAATGASPDGNITVSSQDGSRIFSMDRPAGLGSSAPSLRPTAPRQPARSNLFNPSELAVAAEPNDEMTEEEKKLHDKVELIRVKFLRLVYKLGATLKKQ